MISENSWRVKNWCRWRHRRSNVARWATSGEAWYHIMGSGKETTPSVMNIVGGLVCIAISVLKLMNLMKTDIFMLSEYFNTLFCFLLFTLGTFRFCNERNHFWFPLCGKTSKSFQSQSRGKNDPSACLHFAILGSGMKAIFSKKSPIVFCPWYLTKIVQLVEFQK